MNKKITLGILLIVLTLAIAPVFADTIRVEPHGSIFGLPVMLTSPATFYVNVTTSLASPTTDAHIFLVVPESVFNQFSSNPTVIVNWTGGSPTSIAINKTMWTEESVNSVKVPPGTTSGIGYTVASLRSHLNTTENIFWAFVPFLGGQDITTTPKAFTVTMFPQGEMAIYVLGKTGDTDLFNNRSPPTQPGFIVPELAPILLALASFGAFALYTVKRKKALPLK